MSKHLQFIGFAFLLSGMLSSMKLLWSVDDWSWWFCTSPLLITVGVYVLLTILGLIVMFLDKKFFNDMKDL